MVDDKHSLGSRVFHIIRENILSGKYAQGEELKEIVVLADGENQVVEVKGKEFSLNRLHIGNRDTKGVKK